MGDDAYRCPACGKPFKFKKSMENHFEDDHNRGLDEFDKDLSDLDLKLSALRRNDYDQNEDSVTEQNTRQTKFTFKPKEDIKTGKSGQSQL